MNKQLSAEPDDPLRQALAVVVVRGKRKCAQEAAALREKAQRLEAELHELREQRESLHQWVATVLQRHEANETRTHVDKTQGCSYGTSTCTKFLPPLPLEEANHDPASKALQLQLSGSYDTLQQQLVVAAQASGEAYGSVQDVLDGKAAALAGMLLTNVQMLQQLQQAGGAAGKSMDILTQGRPADAVSSIASFITDTLLHVPRSSLAMAYMQQCAALLAAMLVHAAGQLSAAANCPTQALCNSEDQAMQVLQLMQQLLQYRAEGRSFEGAGHLANTSCGSQCPTAPCAAATAMLQQLSTLPSTGLLLFLAVAQHLQQLLEQLLEANQAVLGVTSSTCRGKSDSAEAALLVASRLFIAAPELLLDLECTVMQLPSWGVALSSCSWTASALEDIVAAAAAWHQAVSVLQCQQPLLVARICGLCANLATALQQLAASSTAPGMQSGMGAELRSITAGLCVKLRDMFMPVASGPGC